MSDDLMQKRGTDVSGSKISRRWFIQGAAAVIGATTISFGQERTATIGGKPILPDGPAVANCGCVNEAALPAIAVAKAGGVLYALVGTNNGPGIFQLNIKDKNVVIGRQIGVKLPDDFVWSSIGAVNDRLFITGGERFVIEEYEVDYEMPEDVRLAMDNSIPEGIPTSGKEMIQVMGVAPSVYTLLPSFQKIDLPELPMRSFGVISNVSETVSGDVAFMLEHSDGMNESNYASAVDVIERNGSSWHIWNAGRELGESGPNYLARSADRLVAGINLLEGSRIATESASTNNAGRIVAMTTSHQTPTAVVRDIDGVDRWSSISAEGERTLGNRVGMADDELISVVPISGTRDQVLLLGRNTTQLVENTEGIAAANGGK